MSQSVSRALQILVRLGDGDRSLDELASEVGVHKTTVLRLLRTLEADRFVRHDDRHRYSLGSRLFALADASLEQRTVRDVAAPHLRELSRRTGGHAVHLAAFDGNTVVYIDKVESTSSVRMYSRVGLPAAIHCTAVGKVLTAALPHRRQQEVIADLDFHRYTDRTITDPVAFAEELRAVAEQGWAHDHEEHEALINCIGAPVRDAEGRVVAAVSVTVPKVLLDYGQVRALLPELLAGTSAIHADYARS